MKANVLSIEGKKLKEIELPKCFSHEIRRDIMLKILEAKKIQQPYAPSLLAGKQYSASGKLKHRRSVWKSQYKRGISRIPRKIMTRRGSQFNFVGATIPSAVGGRRAHPPKIFSMFSRNKINKKEMLIALKSALSATANEKEVKNRYEKLKDEEIKNLPFVVEGKILTLKTHDFVKSLEKILGKNLLNISLKKRFVRAGRGSMRGRKYKSNAGILMVLGKDEKTNLNNVEKANVKNLSVDHLAKGAPGRLVIFTEQSIKDLEELK